MISRYKFTIWSLYNPCWFIFEMLRPGWTETTQTLTRKEAEVKTCRSTSALHSTLMSGVLECILTTFSVGVNINANWVKSAPQWSRDTNGCSYLWGIFIEFRERRVIWLKRTKQQEMRLVDPPLWPNPQSAPEIRWWKKENTKFAGEGNVEASINRRLKMIQKGNQSFIIQLALPLSLQKEEWGMMWLAVVWHALLK